MDMDKQYTPSKWVRRCSPDEVVPNHLQFCQSTQVENVKKLPALLNLKYNKTDFVNLFFTTDAQKETISANPEEFKGWILIFIHGGYWAKGVLENKGSYGAPSMTSTEGDGVLYGTIEYKLSPPHRIRGIVSSMNEGVDFLCKKYPRAKLALCGHSAGGHLVAQTLSTQSYRNAQVKVAVLLSGIYSLKEIQETCVNEESGLSLTDQEVQAYSPHNHTDKFSRDVKSVLVICGEYDSPEFKRQSRDYQEKLLTHGLNARNIVVPTLDHFSLAESLANKASFLCRLLRATIDKEQQDAATTR